MQLKICHISDLHGKYKKIVIPECDILICSGDITPLGEKHSIEQFLKWFTNQTQATYKVFISGNHDKGFDPKFYNNIRDMDWVLELFEKYDVSFGHSLSNTIYLEDDFVEILGVKIWGSPWTTWFHGDKWAFNKQRGGNINDIWETIPDDTDIVVTHGPASGYVDYTQDMMAAGCMDLRRRLKKVKPLLHLSGHIHEAYGWDMDDNTYYFNGSICNLHYEPNNQPWLIETDFQEKHIKIINNGYDSRKVEEDLARNYESKVNQVYGGS